MKTIASIITSLALLCLLSSPTVASAASVRIASLDPAKAHTGKSVIISVRIANDTGTPLDVKLVGSVPSGCALKPLQSNVVTLGKCKPTVPANGSFDAKFELSFSNSNLAGEITWTLKEDGWLSQPVLDTKLQTIVPKVGIDQWKTKFTNDLNGDLETGEGGFREIIEKLHGSYISHYKNGSVASLEITTSDKSSDIWEDGYNISQIKVRLHFNWSRSIVSDGWTEFTMVYRVDFETGEPVIVTETPLDLETNATIPPFDLRYSKEWGVLAAKVGAAALAIVKAAGVAAAASS